MIFLTTFQIQVKRSRKSLEVMADVAVCEKSREFNPNLDQASLSLSTDIFHFRHFQSIEYKDVHNFLISDILN